MGIAFMFGTWSPAPYLKEKKKKENQSLSPKSLSNEQLC